VLAVGPMLDPVLAAVTGREVTVLYANTMRPFDGAGLRAGLTVPEVVLVEPYLAGTAARRQGWSPRSSPTCRTDS
jgi:transketolase